MEQQTHQKKSIKHSLLEFYDKRYKQLLVIPFLILLFSLGQIGYQIYSTGDFIKRDVSLKGGVTITLPLDKNADVARLQGQIQQRFPGNEIIVRSLRSTGSNLGIIVEADIDGNSKAQVQELLGSIQSSLGVDISKINYGIEIIGSSLGASFFKESLNALYVAFLFMGLVVFLYFGESLF